MAVCPARAFRVLAFDPHTAGLVLHLGIRIFGASAFGRGVEMRGDFFKVAHNSSAIASQAAILRTGSVMAARSAALSMNPSSMRKHG